MLIELTEQLRKRKLELHLTWQRRDHNKEADAITNGCFDDFNLKNRVEVDFPSFPWLVLLEAMKWSKQVYDIAEAAKQERSSTPFVSSNIWKRKRTAAKDRLRNKEPW